MVGVAHRFDNKEKRSGIRQEFVDHNLLLDVFFEYVSLHETTLKQILTGL
jgi:hypothetical protein